MQVRLRRHDVLRLLCLCLLAVSSPLAARTTPMKQVSCAGQILDSDGKPVGDADVTAFAMLSDGLAGTILLNKTGNATTPNDGTFTLTADPNRAASLSFLGGYVVATKDGLAIGWAAWDMRENLTTSIALGKPVGLAGTVVDEAGKPLKGVQVRANLARTSQSPDGAQRNEWLPGIAPMDALGAQTDAAGRFAFNNLPAGIGVDLLLTAPGRATLFTRPNDPNATTRFKSGRTDITILLPVEARIEGRIVDTATGKGIAGAKMAVVAKSSSSFFDRFVCTSQKDGTFTVGSLGNGEHLIHGDFPSVTVGAVAGVTTKSVLIGVRQGKRPQPQASVQRDNTEPAAQVLVKTSMYEVPTDAAAGVLSPTGQGQDPLGLWLAVGRRAVDELGKPPSMRNLSILALTGQEASIMLGQNVEYTGAYEISDDASARLIPQRVTWIAGTDLRVLVTDADLDKMHLTLALKVQEPNLSTRPFRPGYECQAPSPGTYFSGEAVVGPNEPATFALLRPARPALCVVVTLDRRGAPPAPKPLIGKPLPAFDGMQSVAGEINADRLQDKPLLVCFFDSQQRASRNAVRELARRAEQLRRKGISTTLVHVPNTDAASLRTWLEDNDIPFPALMIQGDEDKARFTWGVKALPWLILTGEDHIAAADGFGVDDLDSNIEKARQ
jgi:hypothetical protein